MSENENQSSENEEYLPSKRFVTQAATICIILTACALWKFSQGQIITAIFNIVPVIHLGFFLIIDILYFIKRCGSYVRKRKSII